MPRAVAAQKAETEETTTAASAQSTAASDAAASFTAVPGSTAAAPENSNSGSAGAGNANTGSDRGSSNASGSSASAGGSSSGGSSSAAGSSGSSTGSGGNTSKPTEPATSTPEPEPEPEFAMTADEIIAYASNYIESTYHYLYVPEFNKNNCGWNAPMTIAKSSNLSASEIQRRIRGSADATYVPGVNNGCYKVYVEMVDADTMKVYMFYG